MPRPNEHSVAYTLPPDGEVGSIESEQVRFDGWRMVALALLSQNVVAGLTFGISGTTIVAMESEFGVSRTVASYCISAVVLMLGLLSPIVGELLQRFSVRSILITGALCCALGYAGLLMASNIYWVIAIYALVLGPAYCLMGPVPASTLVSNWFVQDRGRALGVVNMPLGLFIVPPVSAALVNRYGMDGAFIAAILLSLGVIPMLMYVISRPSDVGQLARGAIARVHPARAAEAAKNKAGATHAVFMRNRYFWVIMLGCCLFTAAAMTLATHIIPLAQERGIALERAAMMLSIFGVFGALGAPFWGWLADRVGPTRAYVVAALLQALLWGGLFYVGDNVVAMLLVVALIGFSGSGAAVPLVAASLAARLEPAAFSRAMGMSYFVKLPFMVGAPILAGYLHDSSGAYQSTILVYVLTLPLVAAAFVLSSVCGNRSVRDSR